MNTTDKLAEALRGIVEGNLGNEPGQANYARIREFAIAALADHDAAKAQPAVLSKPSECIDGCPPQQVCDYCQREEAPAEYEAAKAPSAVSGHAASATYAAAPQPQPSAPSVDASQEWAGMDGATAYHLIDRHADNWDDARAMMEAWLRANQAAPAVDAPAERTQKWFRIELSDQDGLIIAIEPEMMAGRRIDDSEESAIRVAIEHLHGFIGDEAFMAAPADPVRMSEHVAILEGILAENERVQAGFPTKKWWAEECAALRAAIAALQAQPNPPFVGEWHVRAVALGYDGVADMLDSVERGEPPQHVAEVMARAASSAVSAGAALRDHIVALPQAQPSAPAVTSPDDAEAVSACLGDDAAAMLDANPEDERALNMQRGAAIIDATPLSASVATLPARDPARANTEQGLYGKFIVRRADRSDAPGGKHAGCDYYVLDTTHDRFASAALIAYADACEATHAALAADIRKRYLPHGMPVVGGGE